MMATPPWSLQSPARRVQLQNLDAPSANDADSQSPVPPPHCAPDEKSTEPIPCDPPLLAQLARSTPGNRTMSVIAKAEALP
jgi:hypothetical protein